MAQMIDPKLVPREVSGDPFTNGAMTLELNPGGDPVTISENEAAEQDVLKAMFASRTSDGYGTLIRRIVGSKSTAVVRSMIPYTVMQSIRRLVQIHAAQHRNFPKIFKGSRVITDLHIAHVRRVSQTRTSVELGFVTQNSEVTQSVAALKNVR